MELTSRLQNKRGMFPTKNTGKADNEQEGLISKMIKLGLYGNSGLIN